MNNKELKITSEKTSSYGHTGSQLANALELVITDADVAKDSLVSRLTVLLFEAYRYEDRKANSTTSPNYGLKARPV